MLGNEKRFIEEYDGFVAKNNGVYTFPVPRSYLVVGAEKRLYPDASLDSRYPKGSEVFKYVNSGTYMGPAWLVNEALEDMLDNYTQLEDAKIVDPGGCSYGGNDQWLLTRYFMSNGHKVVRDTECKMFQTLGGVERKEVREGALVWHGNGDGGRLLEELVGEVENPQSTKRTAFVVTWLGKLPEEFKYFARSCGSNKGFDWLIFTDQDRPSGCPDNVKFFPLDKEEFEKLSGEKLGRDIELGMAYKLCDYKPLYGFIFAEFLTEYDYWGFCDLDVVFGNLEKFFGKLMQEEYEVIALGGFEVEGLHYRVSGPCSLVKNTPKMRESFYGIDGLEFMLNSFDRYTNFDELTWSNHVRATAKVNISTGEQNFQFDKVISQATWEDGK